MKPKPHHPAAELMPDIDAEEFGALCADIKANGQKDPIEIFEGKVLDGRHRQAACFEIGVKPRYIVLSSKTNPVSHVLSKNLNRRHLTAGQRAAIALSIANMKQGERTDIEPSANLRNVENKGKIEDFEGNTANFQKIDRATAAKHVHVSERSVTALANIADQSPALAKKVASGEISIHSAGEKLKEKKAKSEPVLDETGYPVPEELHELWARRVEVREMLAQISNVENKLLASQKEKDVLFSTVSFSSAVSKLQFAHMEVAAARLWAVCITCQGRNYAKCTLCKGRGFLSKIKWDTCVSKEAKDIRARANK